MRIYIVVKEGERSGHFFDIELITLNKKKAEKKLEEIKKQKDFDASYEDNFIETHTFRLMDVI